MKMKPPNDCKYNGLKVKAGELIEVLDNDIDALTADGWEKAKKAKPKKEKVEDNG